MPKVSVVIPVYNRARYLRSAIDSICAQTLRDLEVIVVDDASTDDSRARAEAHPDGRVRTIACRANQGIAAARNRGVAAANGEYTAFLDSDDLALPQRLQRQVVFLDEHTDHAAVGGWIRWMDAAGRDLKRRKRKAVDAEQIAAERLFRCGLENTTALARTAVLRAYPHDEAFVLASDYELWARIAADYRVAALPEIVVARRAHRGQASAQHADQSRHWRLRIFAAQLKRLGIAYTQRDLENHYQLRRMHKSALRPDSLYVNWAEHWLLALHSANQKHARYPEPLFTSVLALFWAKTCWYALPATRGRSLRCFLASPLRAGLWRYFHAQTATWLRRGL